MGEMTLANFREDLTSALARGALSTTLLDRWINNAQYEFGHAFKFRELEALSSGTLVADTESLVPPVDFRFVHPDGLWISHRDGWSGRLILESRHQYLRRHNTVDEAGEPKYYHIYGSTIYFRPKLDTVVTDYVLHYWKKVPKLVNPGDVAVFDEDWDDVIFTGALYRGHRHFGEHDRYFNIRNDFLALVRSRTNQDDMEPFPEGGINLIGKDDVEEDFQHG